VRVCCYLSSGQGYKQKEIAMSIELETADHRKMAQREDAELLGDFIAQVQTEMENLEEYGDEVHIREYDMRAVALNILLDAYAKMNGN